MPTPRKLALAVAFALSALGTTAASAAGLGRLTVQSALGQPLQAEVEITSLSRDEAASLSAKLAPQDAFRQAGLEYNPALGSLRFAIDRRADGRAFVRISSSQPLNEPFVDLLVELNWASGKFVREYTFLLDPPELKVAKEPVEGAAPAAAVVPPATEPSTAKPAAVQPAAAQPAAAAPSVVPAPAPARPAASSPVPAPAPAATVRARPAVTEAPSADGNVVVKAGDTLAGIAARNKPDGVSLDQAIIAIYRANPKAFFGSPHQMTAGASLAIPDRAAMAGVDDAAARREIRVSASSFNAYRARMADSARTVATGKAGQSASGQVGARVEDKGSGSAAGDQLRLSRSERAAAGAGGLAAGADGSRANGANAERRVANEAALREARSRVTELEKNVTDLQKLLDLKNKQLGDVQKQLEDARNAGRVASGAVGRADAPAPVAAAPKAEAPKAEPPKAEAPKVEPPKAEAPKVEPPKAEAPKAEPPKAAAPAPEAPKPPVVAEAPKAEAPKAPPKSAEAPAESGGLVDDVLGNPLVLPALGALLALGAGYGWYAMRRRKKDEKYEDSLIAAEGFTANSLFGSTGGQSVDTHNSLFTANAQETSEVHSTEVDPIAEAEVYIAYGREAQAEEILKEALKKQPERQAIRLKLLEIYAGRKDPKAFSGIASEMYSMTGGQNEEWPKVVTMGLALDPDNPLYTGKAPIGDDGASGDADDLPELADPVSLDDDRAAPLGRAEAADADLQQSDTAVGFAATKPADSKSSDEMDALDFDLDLDTKIGQPARPAAEPSSLSKAVEGKFELPSLDLEPSAADAKRAAAPVDELADLGDLKIDLPALEELDTRTQVPAEPAAIDLSAIGLDLQPTTVSPAPTADSARWQEMATKLDLASAYEEIGDKEGARELLQEVLKGGDSDQQQKARTMLSKIS